MKHILLPLSFSIAFGTNLNYALHQTHAYPFIQNKTEMILEYQKLNDTVDILNIKEQELGSTLSSFGSIGNMDGYKLDITYGLNDKITLHTNIGMQKIQYGDSTLNNKKYNIFGRYNILQNDFTQTALSLDIGGTINSADKISITNTNYLESLAKKFLDVKDVKITSTAIGVVKKDGTTEILNISSPVSIDIENLQDKTLYISLLNEKKINHTYICGFIKLNYTKISTLIRANIVAADSSTQTKLQNYTLSRNLDRNEKSVNIGFNISTGIDYIFEFEYYYTKFFRSEGLDYIDYNHVFNVDVIKPFNKKWFVFAGGKVMYRQFNGEIPYLYNTYTQTTFDHKYGYAKAGIGYVW